MLNVAVQKAASKMLTVKDVCWVFFLMDKTDSGLPVSSSGDDLANPAPVSSSFT